MHLVGFTVKIYYDARSYERRVYLYFWLKFRDGRDKENGRSVTRVFLDWNYTVE